MRWMCEIQDRYRVHREEVIAAGSDQNTFPTLRYLRYLLDGTERRQDGDYKPGLLVSEEDPKSV